MALKVKFRTQFPANVQVSAPLSFTKNGLAYVFGFDPTTLGDFIGTAPVTWSARQTYSYAPVYDLASGVLSTTELFTASGITVPASHQLNGIRFSAADGSNQTYTVGAGALAIPVYVNAQALVGSDSTSNVYGAVLHATNDGPGNVRGAHLGGFASVGSTGFCSAAGLEMQPVSTSAGSWGAFASLNSSGAGNIAIAYGVETVLGDSFKFALGNSVGPLPVDTAFIRWWQSSGSLGVFLQLLDPTAAIHLFEVDKAGNTTIAPGTLANAANALRITATQPASPVATQNGVAVTITGNGSASQANQAVSITYSAGYTGSSLTAAGAFANANAGTGATLIPASGGNTFVGNAGVNGNCASTTTGTNSGVVGRAASGNVNAGITGLAQSPKNAATNIGVTGSAINTGTTPVHVGIWAHLNQTTPPSVSAALIADNGSQTDPIARFRKAGADMIDIDGNGNLLAVSTGAIGYGTGAGGVVTQLTSKATGVTLSKTSGQITLNNAALAAGTIVSFVLTNTTIAATDVLILNHVSGGTPGSYLLNAQCAAGSATINVRNETAGSLSEAIVIQFVLIKGVTS